MRFGALLRDFRKSADLSQRELACRVGVDHTYLSKIESGLMVPSAALTCRLAEEVGAEPMEFWTAADNVPREVYRVEIDELRRRVLSLEASMKAAGLPLFGPVEVTDGTD